MNAIFEAIGNAIGATAAGVRTFATSVVALLIIFLLGRITTIFDPFGGPGTVIMMVALAVACVYLLRRLVSGRVARWLVAGGFILATWPLIISSVGYFVGNTTAFNILVNHLAVFVAQQNVAARQQMLAADAVEGARIGVVTAKTKRLKNDGAVLDELAVGEKRILRYASSPPSNPAVIRKTGGQKVAVLCDVDSDGFVVEEKCGWVLASRIDDQGNLPVAGLDSGGRTIPNVDVEEIILDLDPKEVSKESFTSYDHGDETRNVASVLLDGGPYEECEAGVCRPVQGYMRNGAKDRKEERQRPKNKTRTVFFGGGPNGAKIKVTITTYKNHEG